MAVDTSGTTIIAEGTKINGKFEVDVKLHIDGEIEGTIESSNVVVIGSKGIVNGEIFAEKLVVSGELEGNADCKDIEILTGGKIIGEITSSNLVIESHGFFEGTSKVKVESDSVDS